MVGVVIPDPNNLQRPARLDRDPVSGLHRKKVVSYDGGSAGVLASRSTCT